MKKRVWSIIGKKFPEFSFTVAIDLLFIGLIISVGRFFGGLIPGDPVAVLNTFGTNALLVTFALIYPILFYLFVLLAYTLAKIFVILIITRMRGKAKNLLSNYWSLYWYNVRLTLLLAISLLVMFGLTSLLIVPEIGKYLILVVGIPIILWYYLALQIGQMHYLKKKQTVRAVLKECVQKFPQYGRTFLWDVLFFGIFVLIYNLLNLALKGIIANPAIGQNYINIISVIGLVWIYFILAFNRVYLFENVHS